MESGMAPCSWVDCPWRQNSNLPPPPPQVHEDQHDQATHEAHAKTQSCCVACFKASEGFLIHQGSHDLGGTRGSALSDDVDVVEDQERPYDGHQHNEGQGRPDAGDRYVAELVPSVRAVYFGSVIQFAVDRLHRRQEQYEDEAPPVPVVHKGHRRQSQLRVAEECYAVQERDAYLRQRGPDATLRVQEVLPDRSVHDAGNDIRDEIHDAEEHLEAGYLREQERSQEAHGYRDGKEDSGPDNVVQECAVELAAGQHLTVVLQADELSGPDPRPLGEGVVDGGYRGSHDNQQVDEHQG